MAAGAAIQVKAGSESFLGARDGSEHGGHLGERILAGVKKLTLFP
jgi:hypothetical protein